MAGSRSPGIIVEQRLQMVENLILEGVNTINSLWPYTSEWGVSKRNVRRYLATAQARLVKGLEENRARVLAKHIRSRYKERARIKRKGIVPKLDDEGNPVYDANGKPVYVDKTDDRMILAIDQDIAKLEGAYEETLNIKGGMNNINAVVDVPLTSEEGERIARELGLLVDKGGKG